MRNMGTGITEDFKYYVENGNPSPNKLKAVKNIILDVINNFLVFIKTLH